MKMKWAVVFLGMLLAILIYPVAYAKCVLPSSDTEEKVSTRNLAGYLVDIKGGDAWIKEYKSGRLVKVDVSGIKVSSKIEQDDGIELSKLMPGIPVKIWYENCGKPSADPPRAAYFEIFSNSEDVQSDFYLANSKCILPEPDYKDTEVAARNLAGYLVRIRGKYAFIKEYKSGKVVRVDVSEIEEPYSAFGGDLKFSELVPGIPVRIWYKNCGKPATNPPEAAYFEFFSNSIADKPPASYLRSKR